MPKTNRQLTAEVNRLRQRVAHLESYVIELSKWVLYEDEPKAAWGPPLVDPPNMAPAIKRLVFDEETPEQQSVGEWEAEQRDRDWADDWAGDQEQPGS